MFCWSCWHYSHQWKQKTPCNGPWLSRDWVSVYITGGITIITKVFARILSGWVDELKTTLAYEATASVFMQILSLFQHLCLQRVIKKWCTRWLTFLHSVQSTLCQCDKLNVVSFIIRIFKWAFNIWTCKNKKMYLISKEQYRFVFL